MIRKVKVSGPTNITRHNTLTHKEVHKNTSSRQNINRNLVGPKASQTDRKQVDSNRHWINKKNVTEIQNGLNCQVPGNFYKSEVQTLMQNSTP